MTEFETSAALWKHRRETGHNIFHFDNDERTWVCEVCTGEMPLSRAAKEAGYDVRM